MSLAPIWTAPDATSTSPFLDPPALTSILAPEYWASNFSLAALMSGCNALDPLTRTVPSEGEAEGAAASASAWAGGGGVLSQPKPSKTQAPEAKTTSLDR